jgi:hypothetical protein
MPTTIGMQSLILLALRRGCERENGQVCKFLGDRFSSRYTRLLVDKKLDVCLNKIRDQFRNPACHGLATFTSQQYQDFAILTVAHSRFAFWNAKGADPNALDSGVLHHHLAECRTFETISNTSGTAKPGSAIGWLVLVAILALVVIVVAIVWFLVWASS